jgi:putative glycerol-1-phosphate prenyltransferase
VVTKLLTKQPKKTATYNRLLEITRHKGCGFVLLLDPDKLKLSAIPDIISHAIENGVDAFFVGGSLLHGNDFDHCIQQIKKAAGSYPVIIFPGSIFQISAHADAILFLSLISGRNPEHLIGNQVLAAPVIHQKQLEAISCGYMLIESGTLTSASFVSNSLPIPRTKPGIALAHALAAQYLGLKSIYLEAGSGAKETVPEEMIQLVAANVELPIFTGGGIRTPEVAAQKARAGANFVVIGNFFEEKNSAARMREFADAIHASANPFSNNGD